MIILLGAMAFVLLSLLAITGLFIGLGLNFLHLVWSQDQGNGRVLLDAAWLGFGLVLTIAQLWHFSRPVNALTLIILTGLSLVGYVTTWNKVKRYDSNIVMGWPFFFSLLTGIFFTGILLNQAIGHIGHSDTGLYHWANAMWNRSYAVVPRLGNLHGRLSFNSSYFFFPAMLDTGIWYQRAFHVANDSLFFIFGLEVLHSLYKALTPAKKNVYVRRFADLDVVLHLATGTLCPKFRHR